MSTGAYTEDQLVEQPAIGLFAEIGWQKTSAWVFDGYLMGKGKTAGLSGEKGAEPSENEDKSVFDEYLMR